MSNCQKGSFSKIPSHKCIIYCYSPPLLRTLNCTSFISHDIHFLVSRLNNIPNCSHFLHGQDTLPKMEPRSKHVVSAMNGLIKPNKVPKVIRERQHHCLRVRNCWVHASEKGMKKFPEVGHWIQESLPTLSSAYNFTTPKPHDQEQPSA